MTSQGISPGVLTPLEVLTKTPDAPEVLKAINATDGVSDVAHVLLASAWGFYLLSIVFGIATLMALTGRLEKHGEGEPSIYSKNLRFFSGMQIGSFLLALALTITFGALAL